MSDTPEKDRARAAFQKLAEDLKRMDPKFSYNPTGQWGSEPIIALYRGNNHVKVTMHVPKSGSRWSSRTDSDHKNTNLFFDTNTSKVESHHNLKLYQKGIEDIVHTKVEQMMGALVDKENREKELKAQGQVAYDHFKKVNGVLISSDRWDSRANGYKIYSSVVKGNAHLKVVYDHEKRVYSLGVTGDRVSSDLTEEQFLAVRKIILGE